MRRVALGLLLAAVAMPAAAATYGESLLAATAVRHREIRSIAINVPKPGGTALHLVYGSAPAGAPRAILPLTNALGEPIGEIVLAVRNRAGEALQRNIAAELSRHIYTAGVLEEPDPFVPGARRSKRGQALVEHLLAKHPRLVTLALHVSLPGASNQIVASNFGRVGKPADKDDLAVIADGRVLKEPTNGGRRLAVELPLLDRHGRRIGALSTSFLVGAGGADAAYGEAIAVRDELARAIPSLAWLDR